MYLMKKLSLLILSMMSISFLTAQTPGSLDISFGNNGTTLVDFGGSSKSLHFFCYSTRSENRDGRIYL